MNRIPRAFPSALILSLVFLFPFAASAVDYMVTQPGDTMATGTLRWAIQQARLNIGVDTVKFNLPAPYKISPTGELPRLDVYPGTIVDGTTQPGYAGSPVVQICGTGAPFGAIGMYVNSDNNMVKGLMIAQFKGVGIFISSGHTNVVEACHVMSNMSAGVDLYAGRFNRIGGTNAARNVISSNGTYGVNVNGQLAGDNVIQGNYIGTGADGTGLLGNRWAGIYVDSAARTIIGGEAPGVRNVIGGNDQGIYLTGTGAVDCVIQGNYIGVDTTGVTQTRNRGAAVYLVDIRRAAIGGTNAAARNVMAGNDSRGLSIENGGENKVFNNYVGVDATGSAAATNSNTGIDIYRSTSNIVGRAGAGNVVAGNGGHGISATYSAGTVIQGNLVGTDATGGYALTNRMNGVSLYDSPRTQIGGTAPGEGCVISASGWWGIQIDGSTSAENRVEGNLVGTDAAGLKAISNASGGIVIYSASNTIGGSAEGRNVISGNRYKGVVLSGTNARFNVVQNNYIGTDITGTNALGNSQAGVHIDNGAFSNAVGGLTSKGNVISGNRDQGVWIYQCPGGNIVRGNLIGTDWTGSNAVPNSSYGVQVEESGGDWIGGNVVALRNVIAGNGNSGVYVDNATGTLVRANLIGVSVSGAVLGNAEGIHVEKGILVEIGGTNGSYGNVVGGNVTEGILVMDSTNVYVGQNYLGITASDLMASNGYSGLDLRRCSWVQVVSNVISCSGWDGVTMQSVSHSTVDGNRIGTDPLGSAARPNGQYGIYLTGNCISNTIGGAGNVVSGNGDTGISLNHTGAVYNLIIGNRIGTDASGMSAIPNGLSGVDMRGGHNTLGGTNPADRNIISGNLYEGVGLFGAGVEGNWIAGNVIGADAAGTNALGNGSYGIYVTVCSNNTIGGLAAGAGNIIAFNGDVGVYVGDTASRTPILGNAIFRNAGLGIDLSPEGVTLNDPQDPDPGANHLQNFPVILWATNYGVLMRVAWSLNSVPSTNFVVELFGSTGPDLTGYGEGERLLDRAFAATDAGGDASGTNLFATPSPPPNFITATASAVGSNETSEFSLRYMLDSDADGMPDGYEAVNFGGYTNGNPIGDPDTDNVSNLDEFIADTSPWDDHSYPQLTGVRAASPTCVVVCAASDQRNYTLSWNSYLGVPGRDFWFEDVPCTMTRGTGEVTFADAYVVTSASYRVRISVP